MGQPKRASRKLKKVAAGKNVRRPVNHQRKSLAARVAHLEQQMTAIQMVLRNTIDHIGDIDGDIDDLFDEDGGE